MITKRVPSNPEFGITASWDSRPIGIFWDQSLIWGLILLDTLNALNIPYRLLTGRDIRNGFLDRYRVLVVPGGWASHKLTSLGESGASAVRRFVRGGGSYLGFCGGAGLALSSAPSLGLVPLERMDPAERLPNASGTIFVQGVCGHPAWEGLPEVLPVSIWWPSQFAWHPMPGMLPLATYLAPGEDFCVADLPVLDLASESIPWPDWETIYGINLNPCRMLGHPAIVELKAGSGHVMLSYPHLETPGDTWGNRLLCGVLTYMDRLASGPLRADDATASENLGCGIAFDAESMGLLKSVRERFEGMIAFGERQLLWRWRNPWLLQWRRGFRGLEYGSLPVLARFAETIAQRLGGVPTQGEPLLLDAPQLFEKADQFCRLAKRLLIEEKLAAQNGKLPKLGAVNPTVDALRARLFGSHMNHAGLCGELFNALDALLCCLLRASCLHSGPN